MSDANVDILKRWFEEVWNQRQKEKIMELMAPECIGHGTADNGGDIHGPREFLTFYERICGAFPDTKVTVEDGFGSGDRVAVRWSATMRHSGDHLGLPATGKDVAITGTTIARIANGKIVEAWDNWDKLAMLQQIGVVQLAASTGA
jgi:steroid delta-isomerase-like uncharacterized protein